jgi:hypothetical protein
VTDFIQDAVSRGDVNSLAMWCRHYRAGERAAKAELVLKGPTVPTLRRLLAKSLDREAAAREESRSLLAARGAL